MEEKPKGFNKFGLDAVNFVKDLFAMYKNMDTDEFQKAKDQLMDAFYIFQTAKLKEKCKRERTETFTRELKKKIGINKLSREEYLREMGIYDKKKKIFMSKVDAFEEEYWKRKESIRKNKIQGQGEHEREYDWHLAARERDAKEEKLKNDLLNSFYGEDEVGEEYGHFDAKTMTKSKFEFETPKERERQPGRYREDNQYSDKNYYFNPEFDNSKPEFDYNRRIKEQRRFQMTPEEQIRSEFQGVSSKSYVPMSNKQLEDSILNVQSFIDKHNSVNDLKICGLTGEMCISPVSTVYGGIYEEESLRSLISLGGLCPKTKKKLKESDIRPLN